MIGRAHRVIPPPGVPRQLGALPPLPPVAGPGVSSPLGKAIFFGFVYFGAVVAAVAFYRYVVNVDIDVERRAEYRRRRLFPKAPRSAGGAPRQPRAKKKSILDEVVEVIAGPEEKEEAPPPPRATTTKKGKRRASSSVDLGPPVKKKYGEGFEGSLEYDEEGGFWNQMKGGKWVPYEHPKSASLEKYPAHTYGGTRPVGNIVTGEKWEIFNKKTGAWEDYDDPSVYGLSLAPCYLRPMADWSTCPPQPGPERDAWILDAVKAGEAEGQWAEIKVEAGGHTAIFTVLADGLKIGGVRINVSATLEQQIADVLGAVLLTPQLADLIWANRVWTAKPHTGAPDNQMGSTARMIEHSQAIDADLAAQGYDGTGIVQTVGKHWVLVNAIANRPDKAANYGWHFLGSGSGYTPATSYTGPGVRVWQGVGTTHNPSHTDYSQICQLVARSCSVDGHDNFAIEDVMTNPDLAPLLTTEGALQLTRQPGVGEEAYGGSGLLPLPSQSGGGDSDSGGGGVFGYVEHSFEESPLLTTAVITAGVTLIRHYAPEIGRFLRRLWKR